MTRRSFALLWAAALMAIAGLSPWPAGADSTPLRAARAALESAAGEGVSTHSSRSTGLVTFLSVAPGHAVEAGPVGGPATERARSFLAFHGAAFGVDDPATMDLVSDSGPDEVGMEHVRFRQTHRGVPVTGGEMTVHLGPAGVEAVNAHTVIDLEGLDIYPSVTAEQARRIAIEALERRPRSAPVVFAAPRLELFNRGLLEGRSTPTRLAWFVEATGFDLRQFLWIDARTGALLLAFSHLPHALVREVYDAELGAALPLPGVLIRSEGQPDTLDSEVDAAYRLSGDVYDYFFDQHQRDGWDGTGSPLLSTVRYCSDTVSCPFDNAYWNGSQMVLGAGWATADDVVAHEITHAVVESTAGLFYYMQSGALSESYADAFGEAVDLGNLSGNDNPEVRWLVGEDAPGGAQRSLMEPELFGDPGRMSDWRFECDDPGEDYGGVHSNSGVPNHAFALMSEGGFSNGVLIEGIGLAKAARLHYRALTVYLLSASGFLDHRNALLRSCQDLVGVDGIEAEDCVGVEHALQAVEMDQPWPCGGVAPTADKLCSGSDVTTHLFFDDLEAGAANWSSSTLMGDNAWFRADYFASSGEWHLWGDDPEVATDSSLEMLSDVVVPPGGAHLVLRHSFGFESDPYDNYDGGVIEHSFDGGASWHDSGSLIAAGAGYRGLIDDSLGNPLGGRKAFVGDSWGYTATQLELSPLVGLDVRFRFRVGADTEIGDYGWFIDDIEIFECPASCLRLPVSGCLDCEPVLALDSGPAVDTFETWVGCQSIVAGTGFGVATAGTVNLIAPTVELTEGFFVETGGELVVTTQ